ncbi:hypothetical protein GLOTRDRAFT_95490 [Gloeophyllum trabeum ATCC 11539]|uniref:Uncharacterized protein n=1 Tax=Gloeophyllum trabeum (strain ATCC 11539 / FP-39264 / Madison 617) TaxID=670483 RepID=S7PY96_GLOTA|nr:uncharacterized protein GLOTRDRAFT_95490 [Gloeophyllum trabeum ATCC 11539]EPQ52611.1 hypothetical protein GLOTRDRAFT_95490 [Gloeophyllum trabeum ATCC 11539]
MLFRLIASLFAVTAIGVASAFSVPSVQAEGRDVPDVTYLYPKQTTTDPFSAIEAAVQGLEQAASQILPEITTLVNSGNATQSNIEPLIQDLVNAIESAMSQVNPFQGQTFFPSVDASQSMAKSMADVINNIATTMDGLTQTNISNVPAVVKPVDLALTPFLGFLGAAVAGLLADIVGLYVSMFSYGTMIHETRFIYEQQVSYDTLCVEPELARVMRIPVLLSLFFASVLHVTGATGLRFGFQDRRDVGGSESVIKRDTISEVESAVASLQQATSPILNQITDLINEGNASVDTVTPVIADLVAAINAASSSLVGLPSVRVKRATNDTDGIASTMGNLISVHTCNFHAFGSTLFTSIVQDITFTMDGLTKTDMALADVQAMLLPMDDALGTFLQQVGSFIAGLLADIVGFLVGGVVTILTYLLLNSILMSLGL